MNNETHQIILVNPKDLTPHSVARTLPELADDEADFIALCDDVKERGILHPIDIDRQNQILDGRHRWRVAKRLNIPLIPAIVRSDADAVNIILESLLLRRHYTKGALALTAHDLIRKAHEKGAQTGMGHSVPHPFTVDQFAERFGISGRLYKQARKLHEIFSKDPGYKDLVLPQILTGDMGLGAAIAGYGGRVATNGKSKPKEDRVRLLNRAWVDLGNRYRFWDKFSDEEKTEVSNTIAVSLRKMPLSLLNTLGRRLKAERKYRQEAK